MTESTRDREWRKIVDTVPEPQRLAAWSALPLITLIPDDEWERMHTGTCVVCGDPARLYPGGWFCTGHIPGGKR